MRRNVWNRRRLPARRERPATFTIEREHGETYDHDAFAVYKHSIYPNSSVLAGQPCRQYVEGGFKTAEEAKAKFPNAEIIAGTTHIPVDQLVAHLPDDGDY